MSADTTIRAVERGDLVHTRRWRDDRRVWSTTLGRPFPTTAEQEERWFESLGQGRFPSTIAWTIVDGDDAFVGLVQLIDVDWLHRTAMFGIWVAPDEWGRGHAGRATDQVCDVAFGDLGLRQIRLRVLGDHDAARQVYERCGFEVEGTMRGAVLVDGAEHDLVVMVRHAPS